MSRQKAIAILLVMLLSIQALPAKGSAMGAQGAILIEQESGRILYEHNSHTPMRIASITKIMTAILAIESEKLNEYATVSERASKTEGSALYLRPKEKVKLLDLIYGLMLRSGNDSAVAIAEHVSGNVEDFVKLMNKKAKEIGMKNTVFSNPHGLDDHEEHYASAYDMAILTQYAMKNKTYAKISGTKRYTFNSPGNGTRTWLNKNKLLTHLYPYCTGGKTGYTQRAKRTLVTTAEKDNLKLIAVTINDRQDWKDHISMFESGFRRYKAIKILDKKEAFNPGLLYSYGDVIPKRTIIYPLLEKERDGITLKYSRGKNKGSVGKVTVMLHDKKIGESDLYIAQPFRPVKEKNWWVRFKERLN